MDLFEISKELENKEVLKWKLHTIFIHCPIPHFPYLKNNEMNFWNLEIDQ